MSAVFLTFRWDIPVVLYGTIKYKQNIAEHISIKDFIKIYSYIVIFNEMFRLQLWAIFWLITFLSKVKYAISNFIVIYEISYNINKKN